MPTFIVLFKRVVAIISNFSFLCVAMESELNLHVKIPDILSSLIEKQNELPLWQIPCPTCSGIVQSFEESNLEDALGEHIYYMHMPWQTTMYLYEYQNKESMPCPLVACNEKLYPCTDDALKKHVKKDHIFSEDVFDLLSSYIKQHRVKINSRQNHALSTVEYEQIDEFNTGKIPQENKSGIFGASTTLPMPMSYNSSVTSGEGELIPFTAIRVIEGSNQNNSTTQASGTQEELIQSITQNKEEFEKQIISFDNLEFRMKCLNKSCQKIFKNHRKKELKNNVLLHILNWHKNGAFSKFDEYIKNNKAIQNLSCYFSEDGCSKKFKAKARMTRMKRHSLIKHPKILCPELKQLEVLMIDGD